MLYCYTRLMNVILRKIVRVVVVHATSLIEVQGVFIQEAQSFRS